MDEEELSKRIAFFFVDDRYNIDSLVDVEYIEQVLHVSTYPKILDNNFKYIVPYVISRYFEHFQMDVTMFGVISMNGNSNLKESYNKLSDYKTKNPASVKDMDDILEGIGRYVKKKTVHHTGLTSWVPDVEHMDLEKFNQWEKYFEGDKLEDEDSQN